MKLKISNSLLATMTAGTLILTGCGISTKDSGVLNLGKDKTNYVTDEEGNLVTDNSTSYSNDNLTHEDYKEIDNDDSLYSVTPIVIANSKVNIREYPSTNSDVLDTLNIGDSLETTDKSDDWYEVKYNDSIAYVNSKFVSTDNIYDFNSPMIGVGYLPHGGNLYNDSNLSSTINYLDNLQDVEIYKDTDNSYLVSSELGVGYIDKNSCVILNQPLVVVDKSSQNLKLYDDNKVIINTPIVSGNESKYKYTPSDEGLFGIDDKRYNTHLIGPTWDSPVDVFMPYNGGEGLHDANWRSNFNNTNYINGNGSHGCINMPPDKAMEASKYLDVGDKVLIKK